MLPETVPCGPRLPIFTENSKLWVEILLTRGDYGADTEYTRNGSGCADDAVREAGRFGRPEQSGGETSRTGAALRLPRRVLPAASLPRPAIRQCSFRARVIDDMSRSPRPAARLAVRTDDPESSSAPRGWQSGKARW